MKITISHLLKLGTVVSILVSVLPSILPNIWFIDILSNFKVQILLFLVIISIINLLSEKSKAIGVTSIILVVWNASFLFNLYFSSKVGEINKLKGTKIVSINLLSNNNDAKKVIDYINSTSPDILILLEYNPKWQSLLKSTTDSYTYQKSEVRNDNFGIGYFSKIESETAVLNFDNTKIPSIKSNVTIHDKLVTILATHPLPPVGQAQFDTRNLHLKSIADRRKDFSEHLIVAGDLNTSSYSKHFNDFLKKANLNDSRNGLGIMPTWPSNYMFLQTTLDQFLVSDKVNVIKRDTGPNVGSDHLPIFMEFRINE